MSKARKDRLVDRCIAIRKEKDLEEAKAKGLRRSRAIYARARSRAWTLKRQTQPDLLSTLKPYRKEPVRRPESKKQTARRRANRRRNKALKAEEATRFAKVPELAEDELPAVPSSPPSPEPSAPGPARSAEPRQPRGELADSPSSPPSMDSNAPFEFMTPPAPTPSGTVAPACIAAPSSGERLLHWGTSTAASSSGEPPQHFASAPTPAQVEAEAAIKREMKEEPHGASEASKLEPTAVPVCNLPTVYPAEYKQMIIDIYDEHNPLRTPGLEATLFAKYQGRMKDLYEAVCKHYSVAPAYLTEPQLIQPAVKEEAESQPPQLAPAVGEQVEVAQPQQEPTGAESDVPAPPSPELADYPDAPITPQVGPEGELIYDQPEPPAP